MKNVAKKKEVKHKIMPFFKYLALVLVIFTVITLGILKFIDVLPGEYFVVLAVLMFLIVGFLSALILTRRGPKKRAFGTLLSLLYIIFLVLVIIYELNTIGFLKKLGFKNYKTENYSVLVLKNSSYKNYDDLNNKNIGCLDYSTDGLKDAKEKLVKKIKPNFKEYDDIGKLKKDFMKSEIDAVLIENAVLSMLAEDDEEFQESYQVLQEFAIEIPINDITKEVDITKDSFNVYVSGVDTYGAVSSVARSDVNMILTINPKTHKVLITSIPRDYYVELASKGEKDKLTHAGIYGVEESVKTLEKLMDIKINYYVKVNFSSLVKVVDSLGGVSVYSKYAFTSLDGYKYKAGYNTVNGERALSFVRERKAFNGGDRVRIENQAAMIEAMINKAISPTIITKYSSMLKALGNSFITNMDTEAITEFIKMQIDDMPTWAVENQALDGSDSSQYTYSYKGAKLYVMMPNMDCVINAQSKIKEVQSDN